MKKISALFVLICMLVSLAACSGLTDKDSIIAMFNENRNVFLQAAASEDFSMVESLTGVESVYIGGNHVDIMCGGAGFGPHTQYYGIYFSHNDNLNAMGYAQNKEALKKQGNGFIYEEGSDYRYYVEPLGDHFFYYELHY